MAKKAKVAAVAEISSNGIQLKVGQVGREGVKMLETLSYPLPIGRDTFTDGKIGFERADKACAVLRNFAQAAREYGVEEVRALGTSAVREAANREYVLDQISVKTGLTVNVLDSREEKFHIYKLMCLFVPKELLQSALMVHIGSGDLGVSVLENGLMTRFQNISVGSLRLSELFVERQDTTRGFRRLVEEYLASFTDYLAPEFLGLDAPLAMRHFIAAGSDLGFIGQLCGAARAGRVTTFSRAAYEGLYEGVKTKSLTRIQEAYGVTREQAEILPPALSIYNDLLSFTQADRIHAPDADLADAALWEALLPEEFAALDAMFAESAVASAKRFAARFRCADAHAEQVAAFALEIFDRMKKAHGLGARERLLLHTAALLHDAGKFVSLKHHYRHSYSLIKDLEIVGLSAEDVAVVAHIALYHSSDSPKTDDPSYRAMRSKNRAITAKLAAILRLADALDRSHTQKACALDARLGADELTVAVEARQDMALEVWSFERKGQFFKEVFGLNAVLKVKKV